MAFELRPYQAAIVQQVREHFIAGTRRVLVQLPTGGGKCLGKGTPVMRYDGVVVPVENVAPGDLLMGPDSKPRRVLSICFGHENLYRVTPTKGDPYVVNESHILSLRRTSESASPRFPCEMRAGEVVNVGVLDYLARSKYWRHIHLGWRAAVDFESNCALEVDPYFLGAWLGDGHSTKTMVTSGDREISDYCAGYFAGLGLRLKVEPNSPNSENFYALRQDGDKPNRLRDALRYIGVWDNKHIPHQYKTASRADRLALVAGILDTDGHWDGKGYHLTLSNERLFDDFLFVVRSLGFAAYKKRKRKTCGNNGVTGDYFSCSISGDWSEIPCRVARKKPRARLQKRNPLNVGITVEPFGPGHYFGFELDGPDRLFLLGDFTVTHNTALTADMFGTATARGHRSFFICHRRELVGQASETFTTTGIPHGMVAAGMTGNRAAPVQVCGIQTLVNRLDRYGTPQMIAFDEAHHLAASTWREVYKAFPNAYVIGLTATPERLDGQGLSEFFDAMVTGPSTAELIEAGYLAPYRLFAPQAPDLTGIHKRGGDFAKGELEGVMDKPAITGDAVSHYRKLADGKRAVAFCVSIKHSLDVVESFRRNGYMALHVDGSTPPADRDAAIRAFKRGAIQVLSNVDLFGEGFDLPAIEVAILLRPTNSLSLYLQQVGRALRTSPGKKDAVILDHAGNSARHGLPDDPRTWTLDGREKSKRDGASEMPVKTCPDCFRVVSSARRECSCGYVWPVVAREIEHRDGELVEIATATPNPARREQGSARTLAELIRLGAARGYKNPAAWASHVLRGRKGAA